jgi:ribose transport system permease protein
MTTISVRPTSNLGSFGAAFRHAAREHSSLFALILAVALLIANVASLPQFASPSEVPGELGTLAPFVLIAMASTPAILSGGAGIDLSVAPLMGLVNVMFVVYFLPHGLGNPAIAIPSMLIVGGLVGTANGVMVAVLRFPPVIATLGTYFVLAGLGLDIAPDPVSASNNWTDQLATSIGHIPGAVFTIGGAFLFWYLIRRLPYHRALLAVGGGDAAAFSAGVNATLVRLLAYTIGGMMAGLAGLALTGTIQSADTTVWPDYVIVALAAVALGGTSLSGGRGGFVCAALGATCVFLIQNLISVLGVSVFYLQVAYGAVLLVAVVLGSSLSGQNAPNMAGGNLAGGST